uniref:Uncharacterized protein n=1 Tax=Panagrolaimus sp. ES5 TaxID=591445 RepID=A0AC34FVS3_9BILA
MAGYLFSDDGFVEVIIASGCAAAIIASWVIGILLIFFPRHETETYRRRLVANMPRARDETLPTELQLQSTIDSISVANAVPGQPSVDATKDDETQPQDELAEDGGSIKNDTKDETKDQKQEKKPKPSVPKKEQPEKPEKKKEKAVEKKQEKPVEKKQEKPAEKKPAKVAEKKDDKKGKEEKPKEKDKKKK